MQVIRIMIMIILCMVFYACIEPYTPDIEEYMDLMVINGKITDREGLQYVDVSRTSSYNDPIPKPVEDCDVKVFDDRGNTFQYTEELPGRYSCRIGKQYLVPGTRYKVEVMTREGTVYQSAYDVMNTCPDIDTIYYEVSEEAPLNYLLSPYPGLQFFIDTRESAESVSNFRWELEETWEYHSWYAIGDYFDGVIHYVEPDNYTDALAYCWRSGPIRKIFTMSTRNLTTNKITRGYLNFVSNQTDRLSVKYSLLVRQYSLSDSAYEYWSRMQRMIQETGGLYETQPMQITGNMRNLNDPKETVLGLFWAAAVKEKRIFYRRSYEFRVLEPDCDMYELSEDELMEYLEQVPEEAYPVYLINLTLTEEGPWDLADQKCFDCRKRHGTLVKPDFWE